MTNTNFCVPFQAVLEIQRHQYDSGLRQLCSQALWLCVHVCECVNVRVHMNEVNIVYLSCVSRQHLFLGSRDDQRGMNGGQ